MKTKKAAMPYPKSFPPERFFVETEAIDRAKALALKDLIESNAGETAVDRFLQQYPALLAACMNFTQFGHHGSWVVPQQIVRPPSLPAIRGLKPDYLVGGRSSGGYYWSVVELKGTTDRLFRTNAGGSVTLSSVANLGMCQLLQYIDYCSAAQSYLRDTLKLKGFREPTGFLIIGRQAEFSDRVLRDLKAALNRSFSGHIQVRTYDALLRSHGLSWIDEERGDSM